MKIISVGNLKGGVGKTTIAVNVACAFASTKHSVAIIDADPQESASDWLENPPNNVTMYKDPLKRTKPHDLKMWIDRTLEKRKYHDYCFIDLPPQLDVISGIAIGMSDLVIVPSGSSKLDINATVKTMDILDTAREQHDGKPKCLLVANRVDMRTSLGKTFSDVVLKKFHESIGQDIALRSSHMHSVSYGIWIGAYEKNTKAHLEIMKLASQVKSLLEDSPNTRKSKTEKVEGGIHA